MRSAARASALTAPNPTTTLCNELRDRAICHQIPASLRLGPQFEARRSGHAPRTTLTRTEWKSRPSASASTPKIHLSFHSARLIQEDLRFHSGSLLSQFASGQGVTAHPQHIPHGLRMGSFVNISSTAGRADMLPRRLQLSIHDLTAPPSGPYHTVAQPGAPNVGPQGWGSDGRYINKNRYHFRKIFWTTSCPFRAAPFFETGRWRSSPHVRWDTAAASCRSCSLHSGVACCTRGRPGDPPPPPA